MPLTTTLSPASETVQDDTPIADGSACFHGTGLRLTLTVHHEHLQSLLAVRNRPGRNGDDILKATPV